MQHPEQDTDTLRFCRFELQPQERLLLDEGRVLELGARAFDVLCVLAESPGRLVRKQALLERVWPGLRVEENNIAVQINTLRRLLGSDCIQTVRGHGYRFVAPPADR